MQLVVNYVAEGSSSDQRHSYRASDIRSKSGEFSKIFLFSKLMKWLVKKAVN